MNIKILEQKEVPVLKRKEVVLKIESPDKTPSNQEVKKELASLLKSKEELIVVKSINQVYGKRTSKVEAYIYKDEKSLKEIEKPVEKKVEKPKEGETPATPKPEAPKEGETPKPEEKKEAPAEETK